ncbi:MAG: DUF459 domain-containing protein [Solidesulfovibrio sp. DCME]|uniref:SGNH/GDSL hydrolase family protein n=1 Tax=Solidesulfovibrio sp. DCME TaxID=3447380 RepID=UPI003D141470
MRPVTVSLCSALLAAALGLMPACVKPTGSGEQTAEPRPEPASADSQSAAPNAAEAMVKPVPEAAPPAAAPPANLALDLAPATPPPPSAPPEELTKKTLEPKPVQAAALPQPKSEPVAPPPSEAKAKAGEAAPEAKAGPPKKGKNQPPDDASGPAGQQADAALALKTKETASARDAAAPPAPGQRPGRGASVAVVGDSLAVGVGMTMAQHLEGAHGLGCQPLGKVSTGLINKKFFDWEKKLSELVAREKLAAVVVVMGGNDANNAIGGKQPGSPQWAEAYRGKAESFLRIASGAGVKVIWVGLPAMRDAAYNDRVRAVNAAAKQACATVGGCAYMEASTLFTDASGNYVQAKDIGGKHVSLRAKDGVHMTMTGYDLLCGQVLEKLSATGALPAGQ